MEKIGNHRRHDIVHAVVLAYARGNSLIRMQSTGASFIVQYADEEIAMDEHLIDQIEAAIQQPLVLVSAGSDAEILPLQLAIPKVTDFLWRAAVVELKTTLGMDDWKREHCMDHSLRKWYRQLQAQEVVLV